MVEIIRNTEVRFPICNLDGGHCSFMTMNGKVVNNPYKPEHEVEDGIFITEGSL